MTSSEVLEEIRALVENGRYVLGRHAGMHMAEEGFEKENLVGAVMGGRLLETYPAERRYLIAGRFHVSAKNVCPLHVVCELVAAPKGTTGAAHFGRDADQVVCFVTAYIPRPPDWISPHVRA